MKCILSCPVCKRKLISVLLGLGFGFLCAHLAHQSPELAAIENYWTSASAWVIIYNRVLIGFFVFTAGAFTVHPIFKFRIHPILRGAACGALVSLINAIGVLTMPEMENLTQIFWGTIITGAIYGAIIDLVATRFGGEGKVLLEPCVCEKKEQVDPV